jgi:cyclopropane fatty-acyl-phospholipid synthase-like methyltransferase
MTDDSSRFTHHVSRVEAGYDAMAEQYLATKKVDDPDTLAGLESLARALSPGARVLDLGCGAGVPVTKWFAEHGYLITGVDVSEKQLELARELVPGATFLKADMSTLDFSALTFDAVTAFYSIIHVSRTEHPALLARIHNWLKPGGAFLATWPLTEWEGEEENWEGWGASMWWSHYGADRNIDMLRDAGFTIESADPHLGAEQWLWVVARKPT